MSADEPLPGDRAPSTLAFLLSQVGVFASQQFAARIEAAGLHPALFRILNLVDAGAGQSQHQLGQAIHAPASRMVALVDELEQDGLVERRPHPEDRRIRTLHLTAKGRRALERGRQIAREHEEAIAQGLSESERKRLTGLLQKVVAEQGIGAGVHPGLGRRPGPQ